MRPRVFMCIVLLGACAAKPGPPASAGELIKRGLAAVTARDAVAFAALMPTLDQVLAACPDEPKLREMFKDSADYVAKRNERVAGQLATCADIDWARAVQQSVIGGGPTADKTVGNCPGMARLKDVEATYELDGKRFLLKINDPARFGDTYLFTDVAWCEKARSSDSN
jgi:hypothetical protein